MDTRSKALQLLITLTKTFHTTFTPLFNSLKWSSFDKEVGRECTNEVASNTSPTVSTKLRRISFHAIDFLHVAECCKACAVQC